MSKSEEKQGFIIYKSYYEPIRFLENEQLGRLFRAIFEWQISGKADPEPDILIAFNFFVKQFIFDNGRYGETCEKNRQNALLRWHPEMRTDATVCDRIQEDAKDADKDKDKDKDSTIVGNSLALPFTDPEFVETWNELRTQPKWKHKTVRALKMALTQLGKYDVSFAVQLMQTAIAGNYQGVVFNDTPSSYEQWLKLQSRPQPKADQDKGNGDIYSMYNYDD